jgi:hypothetical protein
MKKLLLASLLLLMVIGLAVLFAFKKRPGPMRLALPDGTTVTLVGATGGEGYKGSSLLGVLMSPLPGRWQQAIWTWSDYRIFSGTLMNVRGEANLSVFVARRTNSVGAPMPAGGYYRAFLADQGNFISGEESDIFWNYYLGGCRAGPVQFKVFPRRSRELTMHIFYHSPTGTVSDCGSFTFANPRFQNYPEWAAEKLPATKQAGDLEAALLSLVTGFNNHTTQNAQANGRLVTTPDTNRVDGNNYTAAELKLRPLENTNEEWEVAGVVVSDATGNCATNTSMSWSAGPAIIFAPSLWPGESAWKLKALVKREAGFHPEELFVLRNVPMGAAGRTNYPGWVTNFAGVTVGLQRVEHRAPVTGNSWSSSSMSRVVFTNSALGADMYLDLVGVVFEAGVTNRSDSSERGAIERSCYFRQIPGHAQTADFIFAVQHGRAVEFTVKPELPGPGQISRE